MLDQLVESKSGGSDTGLRNGLLATSLLLVGLVFMGGLLWSLFAKEAIVSDDLTLSNLVAPVPVPEAEPPKPEIKPEEKKQVDVKQTDIAVRKDNIMRVDEAPKEPPKDISANQSNVKPRPNTAFVVNPNAVESDAKPTQGTPRESTATPTRVQSTPRPPEDKDDPPPPTPKPTPPPTPKPTPTPPPVPKGPVSGGVVNGKATSLPKPPYPAAAKAVRASGSVSVQVLIDENGGVISANATSGHPLLRQAAEQAARSARFSPTLLSGQKVKVSGVIVYNFVAQ